MKVKFAETITKQTGKIFYGWWVVAAGFFINAFGVGTFFYGFSAFFNPMVEEFRCSRALISGVYSLSRLEGGLEGPIAGWLIDRYGARKMLRIGITIVGIGYMMLFFVKSPLGLYIVFGLLLSLGFNLGYTHACIATIVKWFIKKRGRALSFIIVGNGVGGAVFVPVIAWLVTLYDWRWAAVIIGLSTLLIPLPLASIMRSTPEKMGLLPDGETKNPESSHFGKNEIDSETISSEGIAEINLTVKEAMRTRAFWAYIACLSLRSFSSTAMVVHQIPHLTDIGIEYQTASGVLGMMVMMSIPGRFIFGWLGDKFNKKGLLFLVCLLQGVGILIFINADSVSLLYVFVLVYGLGYGGFIPNNIGLRADLFGRQNYATIAGISMSLTMVGTVIAPIFAGYIYDVTKSYGAAFHILSASIILSGILFLFIPRISPKVDGGKA